MNHFTSRRSLCALLLAAGAAPGAMAADAGAYPTRPVRLIVPFAAGGTTDIVARAIAPRMAEALGQPLVVDNKGGGGGAIGAHEAARAQPDGYTLGVATVSTTATNAAINPRLPYNPLTDFTPITNIAATPNVLAVHPGFKAQSFAAFVEEVKKNPGKHAYGTAGTGSIGHMLMELMSSRSGLSLTHVPYRGSGPALNDAVAGQVPIVFDNLPSALPLHQGGPAHRAGGGRARAPGPAAPGAHLQGAGAGAGQPQRLLWHLRPQGAVARDRGARLHAAAQRALASPEVRRQIEDTGSRVIGNRPEEFAREIAAENALYRKIATERRIVAD